MQMIPVRVEKYVFFQSGSVKNTLLTQSRACVTELHIISHTLLLTDLHTALDMSLMLEAQQQQQCEAFMDVCCVCRKSRARGREGGQREVSEGRR